jgi:short-subunit dehydrogenase
MTSQSGTALITGASTGIGAVYADRLARRGHDLVLVARDQTRLEALAARLRAETGVAVDVLPADLTSSADLARVEQRFAGDPAISVLVNNAGVGGFGPMAGANVDKVEALISLNVTAVTRLAVAAATAFAARKHGTIINLASVVALAPERFPGAYSASKAFVLTLTQGLHQELSPAGVRVQAVLPGATRTEIWGRAGIDIAVLDPVMVMEVDEMVDAALAALDQGELVTIPSLPDPADWAALEAARAKLGPNLSHNHAAARYKPAASAAA